MGLNRTERFENAGKTFKLIGGKHPLPFKSVILIDDVCTTGATLQVCAGLLKKAGVKKVAAIAIAFEPPPASFNRNQSKTAQICN
jgi:predicted amidophosphoribosyltransferase